MKHQYFGDITDYKKYSILRHLTNTLNDGVLTAWLLTPDDSSNDGRHTKYLSYPGKYRDFEPDIFDSFTRHIHKGHRSIHIVKKENYVPGMKCFEDFMYDDQELRKRYMDKLSKIAVAYNLIFFDPDNGMEVSSVPYGKKKSSKYLYWDELKRFYQLGLSVLVYQHFARVKRDPFIKSHAQAMMNCTGAQKVISMETSWVGFFLLPQERHEKKLLKDIKTLQDKWSVDHLRVRVHEY